MEFVPTSMPRVDDVTNRLFKALIWKPHLSGKFARTAHINLQEMRALKLELKRMCCEDPPSCRLHRRAVIGLDSRVCVGACSKGRSSSFKLNGIMRTMVPYFVGAKVSCSYPWAETHSNPGDHPSRFADILPPIALARNVAALL